MVLGFWGRPADVASVAAEVYHPGLDRYGVWPAAIRAAARRGVAGYLLRFPDWASARWCLGQGLPVIASIRYGAGELTGAAVAATTGHLVVLTGYEGDAVLVNDPAAPDDATVPRRYAVDELRRVWLDRAGVGYVLRPGFMLPPLMFSEEEIEALVLGSQRVARRGDRKLAEAGRNALAKIAAVLPEDLTENLDAGHVIATGQDIAGDAELATIREAIRNEMRLIITYRDDKGAETRRTIWPIALAAPAETALGRRLLRFGEAVHQSAESCLPHLVAEHVYELARAFSSFFAECPVLKAPDSATRASRLALTELTSRQLRIGLGLLGIDVVERM